MTQFESLVGLVSHYSPSGQERRAVAWLVERMKALGYDATWMDEAGNVIGVMGNGPRQLVLLGHIDTVPGEINVEQQGDLLYGRGSVDAKGPLACLADAVAQAGPREGWQFVVIGAVEEERDSEGARFIADRYKPDFLIVGEPNQWDRVALGYKGSAWANVRIKRSQAHTASGDHTAAEVAVDVWLRIKAFVDVFNADKPKAFDKLLVTLRAMETESSDFEQCARLKVGIRLPVEVAPENWYAKLNEIIRDGHFKSDCQVSMEPSGFAVPAWACEKNTPLVRSFLSGIRSLGGEPRFVYKTGTADLNIVAPLWKCPAVVYGPGDSTLDHTPQEHINVQEYARSVTVLSHVLQSIR